LENLNKLFVYVSTYRGVRFILLYFSTFILFSLVSVDVEVAASQQPQSQPQAVTSQGLPVAIVPGLTQNILTVIAFLIGTSSFILGLRIQSAERVSSSSTDLKSSATLPPSAMHKYFDLLILALVIPSIGLNVFGIFMVGIHLYLPDIPYLSILLVLFIPAGAILFLMRKLHAAERRTNV